MKRNQKGFSLIELLIVVAIILIIAAIAIPNLLKSKMAANEASAAESLRTINTSETTYAATCPAIGYSATLVELNTGANCPGGKGLLDNVLGGADPSTKAGYQFTYTPTPTAGQNTSFTIVAIPSSIGVTGQRGFYSDPTNVIRFTPDGTVPTPTSPPLQ
ncbi:MAG TPA: prepilin-type N-terminal cleavage/methylation domain-containing protein [Candidatus Acidoferrum sp.]|nr:prepilin-type N-terminal cleavage/methylation domain-containing protein [Candidatus Acidoferrum sp.]